MRTELVLGNQPALYWLIPGRGKPMTKRIVLAVGVFLVFNGMTTRTYDYRDPAKYCFQMDYIYLYGCFGGPTIPNMIAWGAPLLGGALVFWSFYRGRREKLTARQVGSR